MTEFHKCTFKSWGLEEVGWTMFAWRTEPFTLLYIVPVEGMSVFNEIRLPSHYISVSKSITSHAWSTCYEQQHLICKTIHYCSSEKELAAEAFIISDSLFYLLWRSANILSAIDHEDEKWENKTRCRDFTVLPVITVTSVLTYMHHFSLVMQTWPKRHYDLKDYTWNLFVGQIEMMKLEMHFLKLLS